MKLFLYRILGYALSALVASIAVVRAVLDLIGYSTAADDALVAKGVAEKILLWIISLPWWLPWGVLLIALVVLMWLSWPRQITSAGSAQKDVAQRAADKIEEPASPPEQEDGGAVVEDCGSVPFADRLYVGQHYALKVNLQSEHIFELTFLCFNGNESSVVISGVTGSIVFRWGDNLRDLEERLLPAPAFPTSIEVGVERPGLSEFILAVEQRVESDLAKTMAETIDSVEHAYLDLSGLNIFVAPAEHQGDRVRLRIPNTVRLLKKDDRFFVLGRVSSVSGNMTVGR